MKTRIILSLIVNLFLFSCSTDKSNDVVPNASNAYSNAREIGSGAGGGGGTTVCNPITGVVLKGDYRAGETGVSTIDGSYTIKPCDATQTVVVKIEIIKFDTKVVLMTYDNMPLNGKFHYAAAGMYGTYSAKFTVTNAATNAVLQTLTQSVAIVPKRV